MATREQSCAERLAKHKGGRLDDFRTLAAMTQLDGETLSELYREGSELIAKAKALGLEMPERPTVVEREWYEWDRDADDLREAADQLIGEYSLGLSSYRSFRVELSTGGPADWLEVVCSGDTPRYEPGGEPYEVERIVYHFADWFDHAEEELSGDDLENAEAFVSRVVPELVE